MNDRAQQVCDLCGGVDDDPRHLDAGTETQRFPQPTADVAARVSTAIADLDPADRERLHGQLLDTGTNLHHLDCGAEAGCSYCLQSEARTGGKRGAQLDKALTALNKKTEA